MKRGPLEWGIRLRASACFERIQQKMLGARNAIARSAGRALASATVRSIPAAISGARSRRFAPVQANAIRSLAMPAWTKHYDDFERRHNGPSSKEEAEMLKTIGVSSMNELLEQTIPSNIRSSKPLKVGEGLSEVEALDRLQKIVSTNKVLKSYIGMGYYNTITPPTILRNIIQNPGWYTPYTPYQAEISQGRMESLVNYQTMICELTAMPIAQASLLVYCLKFSVSALDIINPILSRMRVPRRLRQWLCARRSARTRKASFLFPA